jgi:predicted metal-dependent hydrolase
VPVVQYGTREIHYTHIIDNALKHAYITVDFYEGVILKSPAITDEKAQEAIYRKGKWIQEKLKLVERVPQGEVVSGSRLLYLGRRYYVQVVKDASVKSATVAFNQSQFTITVNPDLPARQPAIREALDQFAREKAVIKLPPRVQRWSQTTGLLPSALKFRKLDKRWGSCTNANEIYINVDAVKLPFTLIDYIIVHELVHIRHKAHSKEFYLEIAKFIPDWKERDEKLCGMKL